MTFVFAAVVLAVIVFFATGFTTERKTETNWSDGSPKITSVKKWKITKKCLLALLPLFIILGGCVSSIPAGHTGVLVTFGRVESTVLGEGINFKLPYQTVVKIDNRVQKENYALEAFSSDIQQTDVTGSVNFSIDKQQSQNLYRNVGVNYYQTVIYPRVLENVKLIFSAYSAEELIEARTTLSSSVEEKLQSDMEKYGIQIISVSIENIDFTDTFTDAVEAKQVAQQNKLTTQTEQEAKVIVAESEAKQRVIAAEADAETAKIAADADAYAVRVASEAEAEANQKIAQSLTPELLEYTEIQQWSGEVPQVQSGGSIYPVIDLKD